MPPAAEARAARCDAAALPDFDLSPAGPVSRAFLRHALSSFRAAARQVHALPYGRTADPGDYLAVLAEGRGSCSSKHALLAALAREHGAPVELMLGVYAMDAANTPGVGAALQRRGLASIPEAHCYLVHAGARIDLTRLEGGGAWVGSLLHEERITPEQIGAYKRSVHERFLRQWAAEHGLGADEARAIREQCIHQLAQ